jgi:biotin carboxyl carrier protein
MYKAKVNEALFEVNFSDDKGQKGTINGKDFSMDMVQLGIVYHLIHENQSYTLEVVDFQKEEKICVVKVNNSEYTVALEDRFDSLLHQLGMDNMNSQQVNELKAPMPGLVLDILVEVGTTVTKGDGLLILEAMKMENIIKSPTDGVIKSVEVEKTNAVEKNQVLIKFE